MTAWLMLILTAGCASSAPSGNDAVCEALAPWLPTVAASDSRETKIENLKFREAFGAVCDADRASD